MLINEAKTLVGKIVDLTFLDRFEAEVTHEVEVYDVTFVPLYGPCAITCQGEIRLDRIISFAESELYKKAA